MRADILSLFFLLDKSSHLGKMTGAKLGMEVVGEVVANVV